MAGRREKNERGSRKNVHNKVGGTESEASCHSAEEGAHWRNRSMLRNASRRRRQVVGPRGRRRSRRIDWHKDGQTGRRREWAMRRIQGRGVIDWRKDDRGAKGKQANATLKGGGGHSAGLLLGLWPCVVSR